MNVCLCEPKEWKSVNVVEHLLSSHQILLNEIPFNCLVAKEFKVKPHSQELLMCSFMVVGKTLKGPNYFLITFIKWGNIMQFVFRNINTCSRFLVEITVLGTNQYGVVNVPTFSEKDIPYTVLGTDSSSAVILHFRLIPVV